MSQKQRCRGIKLLAKNLKSYEQAESGCWNPCLPTLTQCSEITSPRLLLTQPGQEISRPPSSALSQAACPQVQSFPGTREATKPRGGSPLTVVIQVCLNWGLCGWRELGDFHNGVREKACVPAGCSYTVLRICIQF